MARVTVKGKQAKIAERTKVKAAIGIDGVSGNGKTMLALILAHALVGKDYKKVYGIDTENNSMLLSVGLTTHLGHKVGNFFHASLTKEDGYSPFNYEYFREDAIAKGCEAIIQDSYTHAWLRKGGVLDAVNQMQQNPKYNKYTAWGHPDIADAKNLLFELVRDDRLHVISTVRVKEAYAMVQENNKAKVVSLGEQQMQADGLQYEFDLMLNLLEPGDKNGKPPKVHVHKSRYEIFEKDEVYDMTEDLIQSLVEYLDTGISIEELNEKTRTELVKSIRTRAKGNSSLLTLFKNEFPGKKVDDLTLKELRKINAQFIEIEMT